jgi:hypothetical protein
MEMAMQKPETAYLKTMSEDEQLEWASDVLWEITDEHAKALDLQGWKIVNKNDPTNWRWPFDSRDSGCDCPDWCEDWHPPMAGEVVPFPPVKDRA